MTSFSKNIKKQINVLHTFSKKIIEERKSVLQTFEESYSSRKRLAMLDLLLKAKHDGINIDDDGIREEVDTFMFEVSEILLTLGTCHNFKKLIS